MPDDGTPPLPSSRQLPGGGIMTSDANMVPVGMNNQQPVQSFADSNFMQDLSSSFRSLYKTVFSLDNSITENGTISGNDQVLTVVNNLGSSLDNHSTVSMNSYDSRNSTLSNQQHQQHQHQAPQPQQQQQHNPMSLHTQSSVMDTPFIEPNGSVNLKSSAHLFSSFSDVIQSFTDSSYWRNMDTDAFRGLMDSMKIAESKNWVLNQSQFSNLQNSMNYFNSLLFRSQNDGNDNCTMDSGNASNMHSNYSLSNSAPAMTRQDMGGQSSMNGNFQPPQRPQQQQQPPQVRQLLSRSANASFYGNPNSMNHNSYNNNRISQLQNSTGSHSSMVRRSTRIARNLQSSDGSISSRSSYPESYNSSNYKYTRSIQRPNSAQSMHSSNGSAVSMQQQQRPSPMGQMPMPAVPMMQQHNVQNAVEEDDDDFDWTSIM